MSKVTFLSIFGLISPFFQAFYFNYQVISEKKTHTLLMDGEMEIPTGFWKSRQKGDLAQVPYTSDNNIENQN